MYIFLFDLKSQQYLQNPTENIGNNEAILIYFKNRF